MAIALTPGQTETFVLESDQEAPQAKRTTFHLRGLSGEQRIMYRNTRFANGPGTGDQFLLACGLTGWDNFFDGDNVAVPFKTEVIDGIKYSHVDNLDYLSDGVVRELADRIYKISQLTKEEQKN